LCSCPSASNLLTSHPPHTHTPPQHKTKAVGGVVAAKSVALAPLKELKPSVLKINALAFHLNKLIAFIDVRERLMFFVFFLCVVQLTTALF
jgi:hypothetical protein